MALAVLCCSKLIWSSKIQGLWPHWKFNILKSMFVSLFSVSQQIHDKSQSHWKEVRQILCINPFSSRIDSWTERVWAHQVGLQWSQLQKLRWLSGGAKEQDWWRRRPPLTLFWWNIIYTSTKVLTMGLHCIGDWTCPPLAAVTSADKNTYHSHPFVLTAPTTLL